MNVAWFGVELALGRRAVTRQLDHSDEVHGIYPLEQGWYVVGEIFLTLFDRGFEAERFEAQLDEIVLDSWSEGDRLRLRDLQERVHEFREVGPPEWLRPLSPSRASG